MQSRAKPRFRAVPLLRALESDLPRAIADKPRAQPRTILDDGRGSSSKTWPAEIVRSRLAFAITNEVLAAAQIARAKIQNADQSPPTWRLFQLAFLLMNIPEQFDPTREEREIVDLIFFPDGGGKTETYLGLTAFTLVLRRLLHPGLSSAGVAVIMRYTLPMLTRDPLERAGALICALELKRRKEPQKLGPNRFSLGWWVGKNRTKEDEDPKSSLHRMPGYAAYIRKYHPFVPIDKCPWCQTPFAQDMAQPNPDPERPLDSRVMCVNPDCEFRWQEQLPEGVPIVATDERDHCRNRCCHRTCSSTTNCI